VAARAAREGHALGAIADCGCGRRLSTPNIANRTPRRVAWAARLLLHLRDLPMCQALPALAIALAFGVVGLVPSLAESASLKTLVISLNIGQGPFDLNTDADGNLFGTTTGGGSDGGGTVFEITGSGFVKRSH
jgi:uncharacterized repeat protein (TIGR03803 family)